MSSMQHQSFDDFVNKIQEQEDKVIEIRQKLLNLISSRIDKDPSAGALDALDKLVDIAVKINQIEPIFGLPDLNLQDSFNEDELAKLDSYKRSARPVNQETFDSLYKEIEGMLAGECEECHGLILYPEGTLKPELCENCENEFS